MRTITIITPSNIEVEYHLAGAGSRLGAFIIDSIIQLLSMAFILGLFLGVNHLTDWHLNQSVLLGAVVVAVFVIHLGYYIICEMMMNGRTPGKALFGMRTIRDNGQPIEFYQALIRGITRSSLDLLYVGVFAILFSKKHKRIGDMAAGTIVVIEKYHAPQSLSFVSHNQPLPPTLPPLADMTPEEREVVESWLRRRDSLPNHGDDLYQKIVAYFNDKQQAIPAYSDITPI